MPNLFRRAKFGLVPVSLTPQGVGVKQRILISYIKTSGLVSAQYDVNAAIEVFNITKEFVGNDFKKWLIANYMDGAGARAPLCRAIAGWVNGHLSGRVVLETVRRDLGRLDFLKNAQEQLQDPIVSNLDVGPIEDMVDFSKVTERNFYEFITLMGSELSAHFCLSLDGLRCK